MKMRLLNLSLMAFAVILFTSCDLENLTSPDDLKESKDIFVENSNAELQVINVFENVNNYAFLSDGKKSVTDGPDVTYDGNSMVLDFGAEGKILVSFSGPMVYSNGLVATVTFDDFVNDGTGLDGTIMLTISDFVPDSRISFAMATDGQLEISNNEGSYLWECNQTIDWETGFATLGTTEDDEFILNGTATQEIEAIVNEMVMTDIVYATSCDYMLSGVIDLTKNVGSDDELVISCDFGVGENEGDFGMCDSWVELTASGLPPFKFQLEQ
jgi:hypothetical protein